MANQEGHYIKSFGPKLLIETGNPQMGVGGKESAGIKATNAVSYTHLTLPTKA